MVQDQANSSALSERVHSEVSLPTEPYTDNQDLFTHSIRQARLRHFSREIIVPLRYRHSIGSPSLSHHGTSSDTLVVGDNVQHYGDDEVNRFFDSNVTDNNGNEIVVATNQNHSITEFIERIITRYNSHKTDRKDRHVIIQRAKERFWNILMRQKCDLEKSNIIFTICRRSWG